jgi:hypothetical protein
MEAALMETHVEQSPSESVRKEIFLALVEAQDQQMTVAQSRRVVSQRFGISESQLRQIEREGLEQQWPPL